MSAHVFTGPFVSARPEHVAGELVPYRALAAVCLGDEAYAAAYAEGRAMTLEQAGCG
jgi:hypothetical protein